MTDQTADPKSRVRRTVHFSGRVQGVGFRFTTEAIAARFTVCGYVKNLPDGRVELVAEGSDDELARFQDAIEQQMGRNIRDVSVENASATGEFSSFNIAY